MEAASPTPLSGPEVVTIKAISWLGPFAANHTVKIGTAEVPVVNGGTREVSVTAISLDPVRISGRGVAARNGGKLEVAANTKVLAPGTAAKILIWGTMPALPGSYSSVLRVQTACGESLAVPVNFAVASSPAWGIGCMLLGLCMMGIISVLAGESDVQSRLRDVLRFRQEAHERLEQTPPPESRAMDVLAMDRDIAAAVAALSRPRGWTFVDHRIGDANERFQSARDKEAALRNSVAGQVPAGLELQELERDWRAFQDHMASIRKRLEETGSTAKLDGLGGAVNDFLGHFAQAYLGVPLTVLGEQIAPQVIRAELALDSGRSTEAAAMAAIVRRSLRRVASTVDQRLSLVLGYYAEGLGMVLDDARIRQRVGADAVKDPDRGTVLGPLDQAAEGLQNDRSLSAFAAAHRRVV
ncbi:MAG: hypothetical protein JO227_22850, partial [Acetobacteraceae bacterium]|nr:hypothetical protein [Acetobacteraceae bacterium]